MSEINVAEYVSYGEKEEFDSEGEMVARILNGKPCSQSNDVVCTGASIKSSYVIVEDFSK